MPDPVLLKSISEPVAVENFSSPDLDLAEIDIDEDNSKHWGVINADECTMFGLDPCALIVFRTAESEKIYVGHFYDVVLAPESFDSMLTALDESFPDKSKIRVDCFGTGNRSEIEFSPAPESHTEKKRALILSELRNRGYEQVNTFWTESGMVSDVQIIGRNKQIEFRECYPDSEGNLFDEY